MSDRLDQLLDLYLLDEASQAERAELVDTLRASRDARRSLVERVTMEAHLFRACGNGRTAVAGRMRATAAHPESIERGEPPRSWLRWRPWMVRGSIAAAVGVAIALGLLLYL